MARIFFNVNQLRCFNDFFFSRFRVEVRENYSGMNELKTLCCYKGGCYFLREFIRVFEVFNEFIELFC